MTESGPAPADTISPSEPPLAAAGATGHKPAAASKLWSVLFKYGITVALLVWIFSSEKNREAFANIWGQPKDWGLLGAALALTLLTVLITFVRWWLLVRALKITCPLTEAVQLGFIGYLLNFVSVGSVGGDLFKVYFLAKDRVGLRAECVASGVADRLLGVYSLFLLVTTITLISGIAEQSPAGIRFVIYTAWALTACLTLGIAFLMSPWLMNSVSDEGLTQLWRPLEMLIRLFRALRLYRHRPGLVLGVIAISAVTHGMYCAVFWLIGHGLQLPTPGFSTQLVVMPLANLAGSVPLPGGGLGAFEGAAALLYSKIPSDPQLTYAQGLLIAFSFRALTIVVAMIGLVYYLISRREVNKALQAAAEDEGKE